MLNRALLLVATLIAVGIGSRANTAVVYGDSTVIFSFEMPDVPDNFPVAGFVDVVFGCTAPYCSTILVKNWQDNYALVTHPPESIVVRAGTKPGLHNLGTVFESGWEYRANEPKDAGWDQFQVTSEMTTIYVEFSLLDNDRKYATFYEVNHASMWMYFFDAGWLYDPDGENSSRWDSFTLVEGNLFYYDPLVEVPEELLDPYSFWPFVQDPEPVSQVPLPGSFLFILSSMAAAAGLALRKGRASLS